ncbi:MAG: heavy metal translocating P-type ATPase metal-binding domain-containing protein [Flavobacteriales bacterium]|nr:heavy metal translocating P-type ATPase metal-binding domain-containing protein [Flavobacteriales bacterium]
MEKETQKDTTCYHCGDYCREELVVFDHKNFCCNGCKSVYEILNQNALTDYYSIEDTPGFKNKAVNANQYKFLDLDDIADTLIDFKEDNKRIVRLFLPEIHCASCVWLLENLQKLHPGVQYSEVNFLKKEAMIAFDISLISFSELAVLLHRIGYPPKFDSQQKTKSSNKKLLLKIGITFFCFGNVMLFSFPEYLNPDESFMDTYRSFFTYLIFGFSLPVILYSSQSYLVSAFKALRSKTVNLDVPISIGIATLYVKSVYDIFTANGPGYMDSFVGFVLFLLAGKWFQEKTYQALSFDRDYKSYFPLAVTQLIGGEELIKQVDKIEVDDVLVIKNEEIIPADATLLSDTASIDYSFVTGESNPIRKKKGDVLYAGGKQTGAAIQVQVTKSLDQSYLTQLWNQNAFKKEEKEGALDLNNTLSRYFILIVLVIAAGSALVWAFIDPGRIVEVLVAVLIVACPCALALSIPFTFGNSLRVAGNNGLYLKNSSVIEDLGKVTDVVFDKTGTLTRQDQSSISYHGEGLSPESMAQLYAVTKNSTHPISRLIAGYCSSAELTNPEVRNYSEHTGKGITAQVQDACWQIGSKDFVGVNETDQQLRTRTYIKCNDRVLGYFQLQNTYRSGMEDLIGTLSKPCKLHVLSGDNENEKERLEQVFGKESPLLFNQKPIDKLNYINSVKTDNKVVMMVGDGLNDAGALKQSDVGIVLAEDVYNFSPACDGILDARNLNQLPELIQLGKYSLFVLRVSYFISLLYNGIGLSFALTDRLSPLIAAVLMPLSSISVVLITTLLVKLYAQKHLSGKN